jgi:hypothetical protein
MILTPAGVDAAAPAAAAVLAQHFFYRWRTNGIRVYKYNIISKTTTKMVRTYVPLVLEYRGMYTPCVLYQWYHGTSTIGRKAGRR